MADQKPFEETIVSAINFVFSRAPLNPRCGEALLPLLHLICTTDITQNHEAIIVALEKCIAVLLEKWTSDIKETIDSVLAQKEVAEKVAKYEGIINFFESDSLMKDLSQLMNPSHGITKISFKAVSTGRLNVTVTLPTDFADIIFGSTGLLRDSLWIEKLQRISGPSQAKKESGEAVTLANGDTLQFINKSWWLSETGDLTSVDPPKTKEISRSAAWDLLAQSGILSEVSEEAFKDLNLED